MLTARTGRAVYIRADRPVSEYNQIAAQSAFAPTGYLDDPDWGVAFSSGTLVSPTKVLTAAHVVDENGDLKIDDLGQFKRMSFGLQKNLPGALPANVASVTINPAYRGGIAAYDLAVLTLKKPITNVKPASLYAISGLGLRGALVGYGNQGTGLRDGLTGATDKLAAYNMIGAYQDGSLLTDFDSPAKTTNTFGSATPLLDEGTTAPGDSGGPLYAWVNNSTWRVVGVLHGGYNNFGADSHYGDVSQYAALTDAKNVSFLKSQGLTFTSIPRSITDPSGGGTATQRAITVPEPASAALLFPLLVLLGGRRRGRQSV
jgi:V8-like Glu-specific endopeptidase